MFVIAQWWVRILRLALSKRMPVFCAFSVRRTSRKRFTDWQKIPMMAVFKLVFDRVSNGAV
jgi:hypothetical protein